MKKSLNARRQAVLSGIVLAAWMACSPAIAQDCEVKLGTAGPMSGGAAGWGLAQKAGTEFMAALTNEAGGLQVGSRKCKVAVVGFDSLYTAAGGAAAANYLASQGVTVVIGPMGAPELLAYRPIAKRQGQLVFTPSFLSDALGADWPHTFHQIQGPVAWGPTLVKAAKERFKFNSVVILGANDQAGTDSVKPLLTIYGSQGVKATDEYFQRGTTNFAPIVTRIMSSKPDVVDIAAVPPGETVVLVRQLLEAGYGGVIGALGGAGPAPALQGAGGEKNLKGFYWLELMPLDDPGLVRFRAEFQRVMKAPAPDNALVYSSAIAVEQVLRAITAAGTDKDVEKISAELRKSTPESRFLGKGGWRGKAQFGVNQELAFPVGMGVIADGKRLGVTRVEIPSE